MWLTLVNPTTTWSRLARRMGSDAMKHFACAPLVASHPIILSMVLFAFLYVLAVQCTWQGREDINLEGVVSMCDR